MAGSPESTLIIQLARMGDLLQTFPLACNLKATADPGEIAILIRPEFFPLAELCPSLDRIALQPVPGAAPPPPHPRLIAFDELRRQGFAHIYPLNFNRRSAGLSELWPAAVNHCWRPDHARHVLVGPSWTNFIFQMVRFRRWSRIHLCDLIAAYMDPGLLRCHAIALDPGQAEKGHLDLAGLAGERLVAFQLGANSFLRRWPIESFNALAGRFIARGYQIVLVGTAGEAVFAKRLLQLLGVQAARAVNLVGRTDLYDLCRVLSRCELLVSGDTGTLHLATALGTRTVSLYFGPAQLYETGPFGNGHLAFYYRHEPCAPCQEANPACGGKAPCRRGIRPAEVFRACGHLLEGKRPEELAGEADGSPSDLFLASHGPQGQDYRRLRVAPITAEEALACALREAGRRLLLSAYNPGPEELRAELAREYLPPSPADRQTLAGLARQFAALADRRPGQAPGGPPVAPPVGCLANLFGGNPPPRLNAACALAAQSLAIICGG